MFFMYNFSIYYFSLLRDFQNNALDKVEFHKVELKG